MAMLFGPDREPLARESLLFISNVGKFEQPVQNLTSGLCGLKMVRPVGGSYFFRLYSAGFGLVIAHRFSRVDVVRWRRENGS